MTNMAERTEHGRSRIEEERSGEPRPEVGEGEGSVGGGEPVLEEVRQAELEEEARAATRGVIGTLPREESKRGECCHGSRLHQEGGDDIRRSGGAGAGALTKGEDCVRE